jgi:hypothetical protein
MLKATKKRRKPIKACKPNADLADALLERFADLRFSSAERRVFLEQAAVLYSRVGNKQRFLRYLDQFFDDAEDEGYTGFKIGYYMRKRLKAKRLPKLEKYTDQRRGAENLGKAPHVSIN